MIGTAAPWKQWIGHDGSVNISNTRGEYVCLVGVLGDPTAKNRDAILADAKLIVEAPETAELVERMKAEIEHLQRICDAAGISTLDGSKL